MRDFKTLLLSIMIFCLASQSVAQSFMRGRVVMADGSVPPVRVDIQRTCPGGASLVEAYTDARGVYWWKDPSSTTLHCVLEAVLTGYESTRIDTSLQQLYLSSEFPALVLKPRGSGTQQGEPLLLPRATSKSWTLSQKAFIAKNWGEAERLIRITLREAPAYAPAWNSLGAVCQHQKKIADAREAYQHAIKLDPGLLIAYLNMTRLEINAERWDDALKYAELLIKADPGHRYVEAYLDTVIARYALHDLAGAEAMLKTALPMDPLHQLPRLEFFMGAVLAAKDDPDGSAEHFKKYLDLAPQAKDAAAVQAYLDHAGLALPAPAETEMPPGLIDPNLPTSGDAWVPGGISALAKAARLKAAASYETFFLEYCRAIVAETSKSNNMRTPGYVTNLEAYMAAVAEVTRLVERQGDKSMIALSLADPKQIQQTRQILALLGWKVVEEDGALRLEPGGQDADGPRQRIPAAFDIDEVTMQQDLQSGKTFRFEIPWENASLAGGAAWWADLVKEFSALPGGMAEGFARDPKVAKTYAALAAMQTGAAEIVARMGVRGLAAQYSDVLWLYSDKFRVSSGAVEAPGGVEAEKVWEKLANASPRDPAAFFRALLVVDRGRVAAFYSALAHADAAHQKFFTNTVARARRFYTWYRNSDELRDGVGGPARIWRPGFFQKVPLDDQGNVRFPGGKAIWANASMSDEEALAHLNSPEALLAVAELEVKRGAPFDAVSAKLLASHFNEWHALFPYFEEMPGLGRGELEALEAFSKAVGGYRKAQQNLVMGEWHSLVALIVLGRKSGSLDDPTGVRAFRHACERLLADDYSAKALEVLREIAGVNPNLDEAVAEGLLHLDAPRRAAFERVRELQGAPRLENLGPSPDPTGTLAALAGLVYGAVVNPESLLISEDPDLIRKHQFVSEGCDTCGSASAERLKLFSPASMLSSDAPPGSRITGGFMHFDNVAKNLVYGGPLITVASAVKSSPKAILSGAASAAPTKETAEETVFRTTARLVQVFATITDSRGRYVDNLTGDGFTIMDDGRAVRVAAFENATSDLSCALLLDTTESMRASLPALKRTALKFIEGLRPNDSVAVYALKDGVTELQSFTTDKKAAARAVLQTEPGGMTALYDGLVRTVRDISVRPGKKAIVAFTDGNDNISLLTGDTAILRAKTAGVPIYTIAKGSDLQDETLGQLAAISRATGGMSFAIHSSSEMASVFEKVFQDVMHGYLLAFQPPDAEGHVWHTIEVILKSPKGRRVRARDGYYPE
jgi:Ca-activated chloride channel homolog